MKTFLYTLGIVVALVASTSPAAAQDDADDGEGDVTEELPVDGEPAAADPEPEVSVEPDAAIEPDGSSPPDGEAGEPAADTASVSDPEPQPAVTDTPTEASAAAATAAEADPIAEEAEETADAADAEAAPARPSGPEFTFANSFFTWTNAVTAHTLAPGAQLTYDPTYIQTFSLTPRFYLTDTTFLWANQVMSLELTDSNFATYNREPLLADTLLDLRQLIAWEGFVFQLQGRVAFPTSKASQAAGRIMQTGLGLTIARPIPEAAGLTIAGTFGYRRWWATRNVANAQETYPGNCVQPTPGEAPVCTQAGGLTTARDLLIGGLTLNISPFTGFNVSFSGFMLGAYGHEVGDANVGINGGQVTYTDDSPSHWRAFTYFALAVAYDVTPWLNLQLGVQNSGVVAPLFNEDASVRSPLSPDTQIFLSTTIGLDSLFGEIVGGGEDDGLTPEERQRRRQGLASTGGRSAF